MIVFYQTDFKVVNFYNLGNCFYKKNDWANAIWYYEKSLKMI